MHISILSAFILSLNILSAQPAIKWQSVQGDIFGDVFNDVLISTSGDVYAVGVFHSNPPAPGAKGVQDVWLIKYSDSGNLLWEKKYGGTEPDQGHSIIQLSNGNLAVVATTESDDGDVSINNGNQDVWVFSIDTSGTLLWEENIGGSGFDKGKRAIATPNGLAVVYEKGIPDYDLAISFMTNSGTVQSSYYFGSSCIDKCVDGIRLSDGSYVLTAIVECATGDVSNVYDNDDVWLVRIDDSGKIIWEKTYGGIGNDAPGSLIQGSNGNIYVMAQSLFSDNDVPPLKGGQDIWIFAVDTANGAIIWSKTYGSTSNDFVESASSYNNELYVTGTAGSGGGDLSGTANGKQDVWVLKLDLTGNLIWEANFGSSQNDKGYGIVANGQNLLVSGFSAAADGDVPQNFGSSDAWLLSLSTNPVGQVETRLVDMQVYPQPFTGVLNLLLNQHLYQVSIFSLGGVKVFQEECAEPECRLNPDQLPTGVYLLEAQTSTGKISKRIVKVP